MKKSFFIAGTIALASLTGCQTMTHSDTETVNLIGQWKVESIAGQPVIDYSPAAMIFEADGKLYGNNSCNNFFGSYSHNGEQLSLMPAGNTMKACIDALMAQEKLMNQAMPEVVSLAMKKGVLHFFDKDQTTLFTLTRND